jgi:O-antigen/teichoic acid export membrane protein
MGFKMQKSITFNIFYKIILNTFNIILPILVGPYAYRTLRADSMGTVNFAETIFNYFFIFALFGVYQYGIREISKVKNEPKKVSQLFTSLFTINFITSSLAMVAFALFSYFQYRTELVYPVLLIFGINFISNMFYVEWLNEAHENYDFIAIKTIIVRLIYVALLFTLIHGVEDYKQFAALLALSTFLNNFISFLYIKSKVKFDFSNLTIVPHLKPLFIVVIFSNASILYTQLDRYLIGEYVGKSYLAYFTMTFQIMVIIKTLLVSAIQATLPRLSYLSGINDEVGYETLLNKISKLYFVTLFPAAVGLFLISDLVVLIYGGKEFAPAGSTLAVFSIYMVSSGIESILTNQIIYIKKRENILVRLLFLCGFINLALNLSLLYFKILTPTTAVASTLVANTLLVVFEYIFIKKKLKVNYTLFDTGKLKYFYYSLVFIPITFIIRAFLTHTLLLALVIMAVNALVYFLILYFTKDEIFFIFIGKIKAKLNIS